MSEEEVVNRTHGMPASVDSLAADLESLGVEPGIVLLVHSSLSSLGWVCGGPVAVIQALERVLGPEGTLVMPAYSGDLSEPSRWKAPPVPEEWWSRIRETMPAYDARLTPTREMGAIAECFRTREGVVRSSHPTTSFSARGPKAEAVAGTHSLGYTLGDGSPLSRIYDLNGWILMLGTAFGCNSSLHLSEYRAAGPPRRVVRCGSPVLVDGKRKWVEYDDIELSCSDFEQIGASILKDTEFVRKGRVALADALLMPQRALVDYAVRWMERNRRSP